MHPVFFPEPETHGALFYPLRNKKCSWFSLQNQMNSNEIKRNQIFLTNIHSLFYNITVAIAANKIRKE